MIQIRPVSDLRNKYLEIETTVKGGEPVFLTKNGYGTMVVLSLEQYSKLIDSPIATESEEKMMDKSDELAAQSDVRLSGEEVFGGLRSKLNKLKVEKTVLA
jgi:PHD/YefM family antitoxin component YafN of YafNO toxin-antitoxin module